MTRPIFLAACALFMLVPHAGAQELSIQLRELPPRLGFPLPAGTNLVLTAQVTGGSAQEVWLARERNARLRILLTRVAGGRYQINLADPEVEPALTARGRTGRFHVFARSLDGRLFASIPVQFGPHKHDGITTTRSVRSGGAWRPIPLKPWKRKWCDPAAIEAIKVECTSAPLSPHARAEIGKATYPFAQSEGGLRLSLVLTPKIQNLWQEHGVLHVVHGKDMSEREMFVLHAIPDQLELPEKATCLTVIQRRTQKIPGSRGYLKLHLDDITRGQVTIDVHAGADRVVKRRSMSHGESVTFKMGRRTYTLMVASLVNFIIGDDYGIFVLYEKHLPEEVKIEALIAMVRHTRVFFYEGEAEVTRSWMKKRLEESRLGWKSKKKTLEDFITRVADPGAKKPLTVRLPNEEPRDLREWLVDQATVFQTETDPKRSKR